MDFMTMIIIFHYYEIAADDVGLCIMCKKRVLTTTNLNQPPTET